MIFANRYKNPCTSLINPSLSSSELPMDGRILLLRLGIVQPARRFPGPSPPPSPCPLRRGREGEGVAVFIIITLTDYSVYYVLCALHHDRENPSQCTPTGLPAALVSDRLYSRPGQF